MALIFITALPWHPLLRISTEIEHNKGTIEVGQMSARLNDRLFIGIGCALLYTLIRHFPGLITELSRRYHETGSMGQYQSLYVSWKEGSSRS